MTTKRMTSVSVADLHDSVSNLSLHTSDSAAKIPKNFESKYIKLDEIGRGGFSFVYKCQDRSTGIIYAVKIIDLRPLRLRDNFDPNRLRREVDIMKNLRHSNIVQFIEYYETPDEFFMILEYCPCKELFDVILSKQSLTEEEARPIFYQICNAVGYLHSKNIMHRDIKPENILILDAPDPHTGQPIIKLLDFGLSKNAGNGSAGKSFVGTPCYLAPEVEYTSHGRGGVYGLSADCWSLGALLHVMLVARFPEFERDRRGSIGLVLPSKHWGEMSLQARDLVKSLMEPNSFARLTVREVLNHPWLGPFRSKGSDSLPKPPPLSITYDVEGSSIKEFNQLYSITEEGHGSLGHEFEEEARDVGLAPIPAQNLGAVVLKVSPRTTGQLQGGTFNTDGEANDKLSLGPLLNLQRSIALCFEDALTSYIEFPEVATQIHKGAVLCRKQLMDSTKMLRKVEQTASSVLELFPDLELAVEEGAPELATEFFSVVRGWVVELRETVTSTQLANHDSMMQIHAIIQESTLGLNKRQQEQEQQAKEMYREESWKERVDAASVLKNIKALQMLGDKSTGGISADQIFELFMSLFNSAADDSNKNKNSGADEKEGDKEKEEEEIDVEAEYVADEHNQKQMQLEEEVNMDEAAAVKGFRSETFDSTITLDQMDTIERRDTEDTSESLYAHSFNQVGMLGAHAGSPSGDKLVEALHKLRQVDMILEQLGVFWANTEVVLDVLAKKGQHAEQFVAFANKPKLLARFKERLAEYSKFWQGVRDMCSSYVSNVQPQAETKMRLYEFLEKESSKDTSTMSEQLYDRTLMNRGSSPNIHLADSPERLTPSIDRFDKIDSL